MSTTQKLGALFGAVVLLFAVIGIAAAAAPGVTEQGVSPILHDGANITAAGDGNNDKANCNAADAVEIGDTSGDSTSTNGVTVHMTTGNGESGEQGNEVDFTVDNGVVTIAYIKGGNGYNEYDYGVSGAAWDADLYSPVNGSGNPAGLSHAVFCTGPAQPSEAQSDAPSFEQSQADTTSAPSEAAPSDPVSSEAAPSEAAPSEAAASEPVSSDPVSGAPSFEQRLADLTQCPCDTTAGLANTSHPAGGAWLLVVALGVLLASVVVLTPARAKNRR
ncbi:MAG TPA: hypothetical protein VE011_02235 [Candidatus Dormibacteraeota bacterium]|nr:hypothetical protein [Candidatus Dormibacteraeota bacterium]